METCDKVAIIKKLKAGEISVFTLTDFARLFGIDNQQTLYKKIQRLDKNGVIKRLIKGKYLFLLNKPNEFVIANFLRQPSYVSLESALSFYGIIASFPYQITSITTKRTKLYVFENKSYKYSQVKKNFFWGYERKENFLIAEMEKALLDYLYFGYKGWRVFNPEKLNKQLDLSPINRKKYRRYSKKITSVSFSNFLKKIQL